MLEILKQKNTRSNEIESLVDIIDSVLFSKTIVERAQAVDKLIGWVVSSDTVKPIINVMVARACMNFALKTHGVSDKKFAEILEKDEEALKTVQRLLAEMVDSRQSENEDDGVSSELMIDDLTSNTE